MNIDKELEWLKNNGFKILEAESTRLQLSIKFRDLDKDLLDILQSCLADSTVKLNYCGDNIYSFKIRLFKYIRFKKVMYSLSLAIRKLDIKSRIDLEYLKELFKEKKIIIEESRLTDEDLKRLDDI